MQRYKILHRTYYNFSGFVSLEPHRLLLRPRESHELRIESSVLNLTPSAIIRWHRDVDDNCVAIASFDAKVKQLLIESQVIIQQYNDNPMDFLVEDYARLYPFAYTSEDWNVLSAYANRVENASDTQFQDWIGKIDLTKGTQTFTLLQRICTYICASVQYQRREEPGVQSAAETLRVGCGSCRDLAALFMYVARQLGFAARFVSGYLYTQPSPVDYGSTHAWAEVYLPGAGWIGFDPTLGGAVGADHIAVAVARTPGSIPPIAGSFVGPLGADLEVGVWVTQL